ncbi:MAG TPA: universal stress protein [Candidatus Limnocylindria bacterium]|nr:universal stress protein [Candidatus Limnocylindria bacterium]
MEILFATDGSEGSAHALDVLCDLPLGKRDHVIVLSVPVHQSLGLTFDGSSGVLIAELIEAEEQRAQEVARAAARRLSAIGFAANAVTADEGTPPMTIMSYLRRHPVDLVLIGSRGLGNVMSTVLGSTARALARHSPVPVLVVRGRREAPRRILAAVDGSADSDAAIALLAGLPLPLDAEITCMHVTPEPIVHRTLIDGINEAIERAQKTAASVVLERAAKTLGSHGRIAAIVAERGHVAEQVLARAEAMGADLIVLGSRGQTLGRGFLQGSVAERVLSEAHCAVLVAKPAPASPQPAEHRQVAHPLSL